jgi:hypothetical protein
MVCGARSQIWILCAPLRPRYKTPHILGANTQQPTANKWEALFHMSAESALAEPKAKQATRPQQKCRIQRALTQINIAHPDY